MISDAQQRQMTTIECPTVHAVCVDGCQGGCDDLDRVVAGLFADADFKRQVRLTSVNSINWGRVMMQIVHYFYGYFRVAATIGDPVAFSVPTGAVGNLFSGHLARRMGLPVDTLIAANNRNASVHRLLTTGTLERTDLVQSVSSAIDIVDPCNLWRYLYFATGGDDHRIRRWMTRYAATGRITVDPTTRACLEEGLATAAVDDRRALDTMAAMHDHHGYLLDPHGAVAVAGARLAGRQLATQTRIVCLATAHPAKFPLAVGRALDRSGRLPDAATHDSIRQAATHLQRLRTGNVETLARALKRSMRAVAG
jgi:threonine synthase